MMHTSRFSFVVAALGLLAAPTARAQVPATLVQSIPAPAVGAQSGTQFGSSVAVDGGYMVMGAAADDSGAPDAGVVKVFDSTTGELAFVLPNPSPGTADAFGASVAVFGTLVVVGSPNDDTGASDSGSAYVYDLGGVAPTMPMVTLTNPKPDVGSSFGGSVSISGTLLVVGAASDDTGASNTGIAYVYDLSAGSPEVPVITLANPEPSSGDQFGSSVSIDGTIVVVGAPSDNAGGDNAGSAYVYDLSIDPSEIPVVTLHNPQRPVADIAEVEPNSTIATAQALGLPFATVTADGDGTFDYYSFTASAGETITFQIVSGNFDTELFLYDTNGNLLAEDDESGGDGLSLIGHTFVAAGTYVIGVGQFDSTGNLGGISGTVPASGDEYTLQISGAPGNAGDLFGAAVAVSGATVVVGAPQDDSDAMDGGSVYLYDLGGVEPEVVVTTLGNPNPAAGDGFGRAVAVFGTRVVVGTPQADLSGADAGRAYAYDLSSATPGVPVATLNNPTPAAGDSFGRAVAISGASAVVGAPFDNLGASDAGVAYRYDLGGPTPSVPAVTFSSPSPSIGDQFGHAVGISGTLLVVGAQWDDTGATDAGAAYVYDLSSPTPLVPIHVLNNPSPGANDRFGYTAAISGMRIVAGAFSDDTGAPNAGSVYVYDLTSGTPTVPILTLNNPSPATNDHFGIAVAISGTRVVVGAYEDDTAGTVDAGRAYVYDLSSGTPTVPAFTLENPTPAVGDGFGTSVAISISRVVVGAPGDDTVKSDAGSAYAYDLSRPTPTTPVATLNNPSPAVGDAFGTAVGVFDTRIVVGAPADDTAADDAGSIYIYELGSPTPAVPATTISNPFPGTGDYFGYSVAISGTLAVAGAVLADAGAVDAGSVYLFDLTSATPELPVSAVDNPGPATSDQFGFAVAIDGLNFVVGAPSDDLAVVDKGAAYVFAPGVDITRQAIIATDNSATGAGLPDGATFDSFAIPDIGVAGGRVRLSTGQLLDAIFDELGRVLLRGRQTIAVDPGGQMGMISKLQPPTGDAVLATLDPLSGGVTPDNDKVLFTGLQSGTPVAVARTGQPVPGAPELTLGSFVTMDGNGEVTFVSCRLKGAPGGKSIVGVFAVGPMPGDMRLLVRTGMLVDGKQVKVIATLIGQAGSLAEGRWRGGSRALGVRLTFTDRSQALYLIPATATGPQDWLLIAQSGGPAGPDLPGAELASFMLPAYAPGATVFDSLLRIGPGSINRRNSRTVLDAQGIDLGGPVVLRRLAQLAGPAPSPTGGDVTGSGLQAFIDTLAGISGSATYVAKSTLPGRRRADAAIYDATDDGVFKERARIGEPAPGGGRWDRFVSVAKPDGTGYGALVSALLKIDSRSNTAAKRPALFAVNSKGDMVRLLTAGQRLESRGPGSLLKPVKSFVALNAAPGSIGAARGYDDAGKVNVLVTFTDRTQAVVTIQVP